MRDDNKNKYPEIGQWEFWKVSSKGIELYPHMMTLRITKSNNLVARYVDAYNKHRLFYIPNEYWCDASAPVWYPTTNKPYGFFIRRKPIPLTPSEQLAFVAALTDTN